MLCLQTCQKAKEKEQDKEEKESDEKKEESNEPSEKEVVAPPVPSDEGQDKALQGRQPIFRSLSTPEPTAPAQEQVGLGGRSLLNLLRTIFRAFFLPVTNIQSAMTNSMYTTLYNLVLLDVDLYVKCIIIVFS